MQTRAVVFVLALLSFLQVQCKKDVTVIKEDDPPSEIPSAIDTITGFPFDTEVREFKRTDKTRFPATGGFLFIGSSSIRNWDNMEGYFPGQPVIKRGLGGSQLCNWVKYYAPYVVYPYKPKKIFIYAGENDIAAGRTPGDVSADFKIFRKMLNDNLPGTDVYYLSIKTSPCRIHLADLFATSNQLVKAYIDSLPHTQYIDVNTVLLDIKTMQPDSSLFKDDYLHLNNKGYNKWTEILQPYVK